MGDDGSTNDETVRYNVKLVLNVIAVCPDSISPYRVYLDEDMRSPYCFLGDQEPIDALEELCREKFYGDPSVILCTLRLIDIRKNQDRLIIYYSVCVDSDFTPKKGKMVRTESLNSEILRKIMTGIDHSIRF